MAQDVMSELTAAKNAEKNIYLLVKARWELHLSHELLLLVTKTGILVQRRASEKAARHDNLRRCGSLAARAEC